MKFFNKKNKKKHVDFGRKPESSGVAQRDWKIMFITFTLLVVVVVLLDGYLFLRVSQGDFFMVDSPTEINSSAVSGKTLINANNYFESRQKEYNNFVAIPPTEIDPSL